MKEILVLKRLNETQRLFSPSFQQRKLLFYRGIDREVQKISKDFLNKCVISESKASNASVLQSRDIPNDNPNMSFMSFMFF